MKVIIDSDEWYPVYSVRDSYGIEVDVEPDALARWEAAAAAFTAAQEEMGNLYEAAADIERQRAAEAKATKEAAERAERERKMAERRAGAAAEQAKRDAMWQQIQASGGLIYDAQGNQVGVIEGSPNNVRLTP